MFMEYLSYSRESKWRINSNAYSNILVDCQGCSVARNCVSMEIHPRPREPQMENRRKKYFNLHACNSPCIDRRVASSTILPPRSVYCRDSIEISSGRSTAFLTCFLHRGNVARCVWTKPSQSIDSWYSRQHYPLTSKKSVFLPFVFAKTPERKPLCENPLLKRTTWTRREIDRS